MDAERDLARRRLLDLVRAECEPYYSTTGGIERVKTKKQREIERAVAEEVVRFAFDHADMRGEHLAPTGLHMELIAEAGGYRFPRPTN